VCWINTIERRVFSAPYEKKDSESKMAYFLAAFGTALTNSESLWTQWEDEYKQVGILTLQGVKGVFYSLSYPNPYGHSGG
jgi:hypothetical protein